MTYDGVGVRDSSGKNGNITRVLLFSEILTDQVPNLYRWFMEQGLLTILIELSARFVTQVIVSHCLLECDYVKFVAIN